MQTQTQVETPGKSRRSNGNAGTEPAAPRRLVSNEALIEVVCVGKSPLLMDAMPPEVVEKTLVRKQRDAIDTESPLDVMAAKKLYRDSDGTIGLPTECLFACLRGGGRKVKVGKGSISTAKTTELPSILTIEETFIKLVIPGGGDPETSWKEDLRRGIMQNGANRVAVGIVRPKFEKWGFTVNVTVDYTGMEGLTETHIQRLFEIAGNRIGLGSYRPSCNGPFGRFRVEAFTVANA